MKKILVALCTFAFLYASMPVDADTRVRGYHRSDGTSVKPHYRSSPNQYKNDNWSTRGNTNPYTGKRGTNSYGGTCTAGRIC